MRFTSTMGNASMGVRNVGSAMLLLGAFGCSSSQPPHSMFSGAPSGGSGSSSGIASGGVGSGHGSASGVGGTSGASASGSSDEGGIFVPPPCNAGLACQQVQCEGGTATTVSGYVYDPAGKVPLYNVVVYVPGGDVPAMKSTGATCDPCSSTISGSLSDALTDASGHFTLTNVPAGVAFPLVMQIGKWRRKVMVPAVTACTSTALTDSNLTRLPRNQAEGDIPRMALTTGAADPLECLLRKIGIDDAEFTTAGGAGAVNLYAGGGFTIAQPDGGMDVHSAASSFAPAQNGGMAFAPATMLWGSAANLEAYDILLMACEGALDADTKMSPDGGPGPTDALYAFENAGGRVFASHWHRYWFSNGPQPVPTVATWKDRIDPVLPPQTVGTGIVNTSFPKGMAFRDWLVNVDASTTPGELPIKDSKDNVDAVNPTEAQDWISMPNPNAGDAGINAVEYLTFNTPIGVDAGAQCGRVVYSDLHVSSGDVTGQPFPTGCVTANLSPQEKALEFMLFDLSSCILTDKIMPMPPR